MEAAVKKRLVAARERVLRREQKAGGGERCAAGRARGGSVPGCGGRTSTKRGDERWGPRAGCWSEARSAAVTYLPPRPGS